MADAKTFTEEEVNAVVEEKLAAAKAEGDTAFKTLWEEAKAAKARAKEFEGLDPKEARELKAKILKLEQQKKAEKAGVTSEELDRLRAEVRDDLLKSEYGKYKTDAERYAAEVRTLRLDGVVKDLMSKNGVRAARVEALYRLTADQFDLTDDGKPMLKDRMGTPVEKFIKEDLVKEYPEFYEGSGSSGGGASKPNAGGVAGGQRVIARGDGSAFLNNIDGLAKGTTTFAPPTE